MRRVECQVSRVLLHVRCEGSLVRSCFFFLICWLLASSSSSRARRRNGKIHMAAAHCHLKMMMMMTTSHGGLFSLHLRHPRMSCLRYACIFPSRRKGADVGLAE